MPFFSIVKKAYWTLALLGGLYAIGLGLLLHPDVQRNAVYMHKLLLTWGKDLTKPSQFGFAKNQVTPFYIPTPDNETIFAWHVLPLGLYSEHRDSIAAQPPGLVENLLETENAKLLMADPEARLIVHFHGNGGTVGAAYRPSYLRSFSAAHPSKIHVLAIDYRGYGLSSGIPSETGLITDGLAAVDYAINQLGVAPSRIAVVGQSLGTAVTFGVADKLAARAPPVELGAVVSIAGFSDMRTLVRSYRVGGIIPILSPLRMYTKIQTKLTEFVYEPWHSADRVRNLVKNSPNLNLVLLHATNDMEIPYVHSKELFYAAVNATREEGVTTEEVEEKKVITKYGDESVRSQWVHGLGDRKIEKWVVGWGGHNQVVGSAGTSVIMAKSLGL